MIDSIRLVRKEYGHKRGHYYYGGGDQYHPLGSLNHIRNAKDFVTDVRDRRWPATF